MEKKANLFLVGAMKAGTTAMMDLLSQHPLIYSSPIKEPNFFVEDLPKELYDPSRFFSLENYFKNEFPKSLHIANIESLDNYNKLFSLAKEERYRLEGSTMYLHAPNTAKHIFNYNPDAFIIISTRDPLERAFSHYNMLTGLSRELRSFEEVIKDEIKEYEANNLSWYSCLGMSFYNVPIEAYNALFRNVIVVDFEKFSKYPQNTIAKMFEKLNLEAINLEDLKNPNTGRKLKFKQLFFFFKRIGLKDLFSKIAPAKFKQWLFKKVTTSKEKEIPLTEATMKKVMYIFQKESL